MKLHNKLHLNAAFASLGCDAVYVGSRPPTFRRSLLVPTTRTKQHFHSYIFPFLFRVLQLLRLLFHFFIFALFFRVSHTYDSFHFLIFNTPLIPKEPFFFSVPSTSKLTYFLYCLTLEYRKDGLSRNVGK